MAARLQIPDSGAMLVLMAVGSSLVMDDRDCGNARLTGLSADCLTKPVWFALAADAIQTGFDCVVKFFAIL